MKFDDFKQIMKAKRLTGKWYPFVGEVEGQSVQVKGYKTWLQTYRVTGLDYSNCMDCSVKQFNDDLEAPFKVKQTVKARTKDDTFIVHEDPGHGWLEVTYDELVALGIENKITQFSYRNGNLCYLEEDCDLGTYFNAIGVNACSEVKIDCRHLENTFIRNLNHYYTGN